MTRSSDLPIFPASGVKCKLQGNMSENIQLSETITSVRMDKWLWAARFFKTRNLAARACDLGRIQSNHQPAKAAREVRVGDLLEIRTESGDFEVEVQDLSDVRGPASVAQTLYSETDASQERRQ